MRSRMGSVEDADGRRAHGGGEDAVDVEALGAGDFDEGDDRGQILGLGSSHDRVDCDLFDGDRGEVGRDDCHLVLRVAGRALEHLPDALAGRRDDGEAVGIALVVHELVDVVAGSEVD